jgi:predicted MPP superfamily phosphohydrolase
MLIGKGLYTSTNEVAAVVSNIYGLAFILYVYFLFILLISHFFHPWLKMFSGKKIAFGVFILSFFLVSFGFFQAQSFKITTWNIPIKGLEKEITIVNIPDLHLGAQRRDGYLKDVISAVNGLNPDLVLVNGDLVDSNIALTDELFSHFKMLKGEKYFTTGNHEYYINTARALELVTGVGFKFLQNEMILTHGLQLIGLLYMNGDLKSNDSHRVNDLTIEEELPKIFRDTSLPTLLMHHSPVGLEYVIKGKVDLMLSGHTHGGQIFPGTFLSRLRFPLNKGFYQQENTSFLVSQGAGTFGPWMRLGTFNEIQFIKLLPKK